MSSWRRVWAEVRAIIRGQWLLFPRLNMQLLRVYGPVTIEGRQSNMVLGKRCRIFHNAHIRLSISRCPGELRIGDDATIDAGCFLNPHGGEINLGKRSYIGIRSVIQGKGRVIIGDWSMLGPHVKVFSSDHIFRSGNGPYRDRGEISESIVVGQNVWIGAGSMLLRGTQLSDDCVVAAASVVKGVFESGRIIRRTAALASAQEHIESSP